MGETGTGKELIARAIHKRSRRSARGFVSVNCASVPKDLIGSELFGHEKEAFTARCTGAWPVRARGGGTLFLDEIGELPPETQIALLRCCRKGSSNGSAETSRFARTCGDHRDES